MIENLDETIQGVQNGLGKEWTVTKLIHNEDAEPCFLVRKIFQTDRLFLAHGFASMLMIFLKPKSLIYEVFPYKYFKSGYQPLAEEIGVEHHFACQEAPISALQGLLLGLIPRQLCMFHVKCRNYARHFNVYITPAMIQHFSMNTVALVNQ